MVDVGQCRSPLTAVGLEDLRLDDLVTGAAHHEVEVVVCWVVAKQVHICGGKGKQVVLKKQPSLRRWTISSWKVLQDRFSNKTGRKAIIFRKGNAACPNAAPYSQRSPCLQESPHFPCKWMATTEGLVHSIWAAQNHMPQRATLS